MMTTAKLGTVNGFHYELATFRNFPFGFDGTIKGLCRAAQSYGAAEGDEISVPTWKTSYRLEAAPHDDRAWGLWPTKIITN